MAQVAENKEGAREKDFFSYPPLLQKLLTRRGITKYEDAELFLNPDYERDTHDPFLLPDMEKAVSRILQAISQEEKIIFYTDYDTDGIPAGVLLRDFFKKINVRNFENYIPHRLQEGYGLHKNAIESFAREGATLIVTADCGITDSDEVAYARSLGIDVIITDHHLPGPELPPAYAVVNPNREDSTYPFPMLCGAGVAFKLVQALIKRGTDTGVISIEPKWERWLLDMVALATIADMVPLLGENRAFAYYGLMVLRKSRRPGLQALLRMARVDQRYLTEEDVGFTIGPRLNAASRLDIPEKAFELLSTEDSVRAQVLAEDLHALNERRKGLVASITKEARRRIGRGDIREVLVLGDLSWNPGLLGLVANHLAEEFGRPVFLWGEGGGGTIKGSCRSDGTVNIVLLMRGAHEAFLEYGGHESSGGFSVARGKLHALEDFLVHAYQAAEKKETGGMVREHDEVLELEAVEWNTYNVVEQLAPFGIGNPKPLFRFENIFVKETRPFGKEGKHTRYFLENQNGAVAQAIQFFSKNTETEDTNQQKNALAMAHLERSIFRGRTELRLRIVDIQM